VSATSSESNSPDVARRDAVALALVDHIGPIKYHDLGAQFGSARHALDEGFPNASTADEARARADHELASCTVAGVRLLLETDSDYPQRLHELRDKPPVIWTVGDLTTLTRPVVAIVGTRTSTAYGERVTREIASACARAGACVVRGMARGIDAAAHRAALDVDGHTCAVLGTGVDISYPVAHRALHRTIASRGLLVSELPIGERATGGSFPQRNRIIAALASVTIIVEAGLRSGAMITARQALDLDRSLAAVPGPIDMPCSAGSNLLLRDGANVIASVEDALALAGLTAPVRVPKTFSTPAEALVWEALAQGALDADTLCARAGLPAREGLAAIGSLELRGAIECALTGEIRRR
jgi:DNA processing protein